MDVVDITTSMPPTKSPKRFLRISTLTYLPQDQLPNKAQTANMSPTNKTAEEVEE